MIRRLLWAFPTGGTFLVDDWDLSPNPTTTRRIIKECLEYEPSLSHEYSPRVPSQKAPDPESIPIISVNVGLRPARRGGARLEKEVITVPLQRQPYTPKPSNITQGLKPRQVTVVHVYGIGGAGYQVSVGRGP